MPFLSLVFTGFIALTFRKAYPKPLMKKIFFVFLLLFSAQAYSQSPKRDKPKIVVGIVIDQMRYDYLFLYMQKYSDDGFGRLIAGGFLCRNANYNYVPTYTGPGHASIYTGTTPAYNGIISNDWFDRNTNKLTYCASDSLVKPIGTDSATGKMSPAKLLTTTITDELRLSNNFKSKVIGISLKDRAAIFSSGKFATAAYWVEDSLFTSSSYYMKSLPDWVEKFNAQKKIDAYFGKSWSKLLVEKEYNSLCDIDDVEYEGDNDGLGRIFPHIIQGSEKKAKTKSYYEAFYTSPFANKILLQFARETIVNEELGKRNVLDMLCVSLSANDYVGHNYGPNSQEVMDITVRTDKMLEEFFKFLENEIGLKNCIITLVADHGIAPIPDYLKKHFPNVDAGKISPKEMRQMSERFLTNAIGSFSDTTHWIDFVIHHNIFISEYACKQKNISVKQAEETIQDSLLQMKEIVDAYCADELENGSRQTPFYTKLENSFYKERSGDVFFVMKPYYNENRGSTATHGAPYEYDAHVPLIFFGKGIAKKESNEDCSPIDLAATLSSLLGIEFPPMNEGRVLEVGNK